MMTESESQPCADNRRHIVNNSFHLLRNITVISLVAMLIAALLLVYLYRQDQLSEHEEIETQDNQDLATRMMNSLDKNIYDLVISSDGLYGDALRTNPKINGLTAELKKYFMTDTLKVKVYNLAGIAVYSSVADEIGKPGSHQKSVNSALHDQIESHMEFRDVFSSSTGEIHNLTLSLVYLPLKHEGKRIGVFEVYSDASPIYKHIEHTTKNIFFVVMGIFTALYSVLFIITFRADRAVTHWQQQIAEFDKKVQNMAFFDALTQLPNRNLLEDRLEQTMSASKRSHRYAALMFLDLDNFKPLNDIHGHKAGDSLLIEAAKRLIFCVREVDTVARFGGDEFVIVLSELDADKAESTTQAGIIAEKIRATIAVPYALPVRHKDGEGITIEHHCTSSIGVVLFFDHEFESEVIIKRADMAMYQAKEAGRNSIRFYDKKA